MYVINVISDRYRPIIKAVVSVTYWNSDCFCTACVKPSKRSSYRLKCVLIAAASILRCLVPTRHRFAAGEPGTVAGESHEALEVSGPSHRIGLSGANKTMLHLLKKAKVQLIKIDQQKQLKLSQVRIGAPHQTCR